ncbi:unnamed protein product, partial [Polarella glacialis]
MDLQPSAAAAGPPCTEPTASRPESPEAPEAPEAPEEPEAPEAPEAPPPPPPSTAAPARTSILEETGQPAANVSQREPTAEPGADDPAMDAVAVKLQAGFRGYQARKSVQLLRLSTSALKVPQPPAEATAKAPAETPKAPPTPPATPEQAATAEEAAEPTAKTSPTEAVVSAGADDPAMDAVAVKLQAGIRGYQARKSVQLLRLSTSALKVPQPPAEATAKAPAETPKAPPTPPATPEQAATAEEAAEPTAKTSPTEAVVSAGADDPAMDAVAVKLQAGIRGYQARKSVQLLRLSTSVLAPTGPVPFQIVAPAPSDEPPELPMAASPRTQVQLEAKVLCAMVFAAALRKVSGLGATGSLPLLQESVIEPPSAELPCPESVELRRAVSAASESASESAEQFATSLVFFAQVLSPSADPEAAEALRLCLASFHSHAEDKSLDKAVARSSASGGVRDAPKNMSALRKEMADDLLRVAVDGSLARALAKQKSDDAWDLGKGGSSESLLCTVDTAVDITADAADVQQPKPAPQDKPPEHQSEHAQSEQQELQERHQLQQQQQEQEQQQQQRQQQQQQQQKQYSSTHPTNNAEQQQEWQDQPGALPGFV